MEVLATEENYLITFHAAGDDPSDFLVITFGGQPSGIAEKGFGTGFCLQRGWDTIHVSQKHGTQYQGLSLDAFKAAVAGKIADREVICYGSSLGAYAAVYYGGPINARIVAAAPMLPAWPRFANRVYADLKITHGEISDHPISDKPPVIIYDSELFRDTFFIDQTVRKAYTEIREVKFPYGGHTVLVSMSRTRQLTPFIEKLFTEDEILPLNLLDEGDPIFHTNRGKLLLSNKNYPDAIKDLTRAFELDPSAKILPDLLVASHRGGLRNEAQALLDSVLAEGEIRLTDGALRRLKLQGLRVPE